MTAVDLLELIVLGGCGVVLLLAGAGVLKASPKRAVNLRTAAAFAVGTAGAGFIAMALNGETIKLPSLILAIGVSLWIIRQMLLHPYIDHELRRSTDWGILDER